MSYTDKTSDFYVDKLFDFTDADELAENDAHIKNTIAAEHRFNTASIDGGHVFVPKATFQGTVEGTSFWYPSTGIYYGMYTDLDYDGGQNLAVILLQYYTSAKGWGTAQIWDASGGIAGRQYWFQGLFFADGTNMRFFNQESNGADKKLTIIKF